MRRLILALGLARLAVFAAAQETQLHTKATVKYDRLPVADVLKDLAGAPGPRYRISGE
jgi:hypothetical protein